MVEVELARTDAEVDAALALAARTWGSPPVSFPMARALTLAGWYVSTAREAGRLVGMCAGLVGLHDHGPHLHSHLAAVVPDAQGRGVGRALKAHQRQWCLDHGIGTVTWTFDPLVRENARFNLHHLGVVGEQYLVDLYGPMDDDINRGQPSDRLLVRWELDSERTRRALAGELVAPVDPTASTTTVPTPEAITALRRDQPEEALRWRLAVRDAMVTAFDAGLRVTGLTSDHAYVLTGAPA